MRTTHRPGNNRVNYAGGKHLRGNNKVNYALARGNDRIKAPQACLRYPLAHIRALRLRGRRRRVAPGLPSTLSYLYPACHLKRVAPLYAVGVHPIRIFHARLPLKNHCRSSQPLS